MFKRSFVFVIVLSFFMVFVCPVSVRAAVSGGLEVEAQSFNSSIMPMSSYSDPYNSDFKTVNTNLTNILTSLNTVKSDVTNSKTNLTNIYTSLLTVKTDVSSIKGKYDTVITYLKLFDTYIGGGSSPSLLSINGRLESIKTDMSTLGVYIQSIETDVGLYLHELSNITHVFGSYDDKDNRTVNGRLYHIMNALTSSSGSDTISASNQQLSSSLSDYDSVESSALSAAVGQIDSSNLSNSVDFGANLVSGLAFWSPVITSIIAGMGDFSILYPLGFFMAFLSILLGVVRFVVRSGGE